MSTKPLGNNAILFARIKFVESNNEKSPVEQPKKKRKNKPGAGRPKNPDRDWADPEMRKAYHKAYYRKRCALVKKAMMIFELAKSSEN